MLNKFIAVLSAAATAITVFFTELSGRGTDLIWLCPLLLMGYFVGLTIVYVVLLYFGTELTISLKKPNDVPNKFWSRVLEILPEWLCFYGRIKVHVSGLEKLPEGRFLMVCNHRSYFDPIVKLPIFKDIGMTYVSKPQNFKIPIGGKLMHAYGCLSLNRENNREALVTIKRGAEIIASDRASVCIYPEGTRSQKQELLPFHAGSFKIAQKASCPLVITTLHGTDRVEKNFPFRRTDVYVDVTEVFDAEFVKSRRSHELAELAQKIVQDKYNEFEKKEQSGC